MIPGKYTMKGTASLDPKMTFLAVAALSVLNPVTATAVNFADYFLLFPDRSRVYENAVDPLNTDTRTALESLTCNGNPPFRVAGTIDDHLIVFTDGVCVTIYASVEDCVLEDQGHGGRSVSSRRCRVNTRIWMTDRTPSPWRSWRPGRSRDCRFHRRAIGPTPSV